jgi:hypothetical protein
MSASMNAHDMMVLTLPFLAAAVALVLGLGVVPAVRRWLTRRSRGDRPA